VTETQRASAALERFARESLGCQCAPEVFSRVEESAAPLPGLPEVRRRIAIGGRLLIYLVEIPDDASMVTRIDRWVAAGRAERDERGMNRLRLVVSLNDPTPVSVTAIEDAFSRLQGLDDRIHLHVLATEAVARI
jgi:hypothetical protein